MISDLAVQVLYLFILAMPVACVAWTVTHEEIFREIRELCLDKSKNHTSPFLRKCFYVFTCEYCFSHYITAIVLAITNYQFLYTGWRGYFIALFCLVWVANIYMNIYAKMRLGLKIKKIETQIKEKQIHE